MSKPEIESTPQSRIAATGGSDARDRKKAVNINKHPLHRRRFRRYCATHKIEPVDTIINGMGVNRTTASKICAGSRRSLADFQVLGEYLQIDGLYFIDQEPLSTNGSDVRLLFAERLEELIIEQKIPQCILDKDGRESPVDVVEYAWQMEDSVLSNLPISFNQQKDAFRLVEEWDLVIERPHEFPPSMPQTIGRMEILHPRRNMLLFEVSIREQIELAAIGLLEQDRDLLAAAQERYPARLDAYRALTKFTNEEDVPASEEFDVDVREAIEADLDCRRALIPTGGAERALRSLYRETRYSLLTMQREEAKRAENSGIFLDRFPDWWKARYYSNGCELAQIGEALGTPGQAADFPKLHKLVSENISALRGTIRGLESPPENFNSGDGI